jgi:hypothetical protein
MLLKKDTHVTFLDQVEGNSSNPVWRKTLSIYIYVFYISSYKLAIKFVDLRGLHICQWLTLQI